MSSDSEFPSSSPLRKRKNNTDELLQAVSNHKAKKTKRSTNDGKLESDPMEIYRNAGRKVSCVLDLFGLPSVAFHTGLQHDRGGKTRDDLTEDIVRRHLHLYDGILYIIPSLRDELDTVSSDKLSKIISVITKGMSDARSTAFSSLKHKGLKYVPLNMHSKKDALDPPIPEVEDKSMRGVAHPQLARWFCPRNKLDVFDRDPDVEMENLQSGKLKMIATNWPTGFYEDGIYDPQDKAKGLFRNHVVVRFYTHLYIGPSAAMSESMTSKASKAARNRAFGLTSVTKNIVAIVHVITYFTLSHAQNWTNEIGTMNLEELFWAIIDMLDDDEDPWVNDTMAWWNARIGSGARNVKALSKEPLEDGDDSDQENDIADIKAQRKARRGIAPQHKAGGSARRLAAFQQAPRQEVLTTVVNSDDNEPPPPIKKTSKVAPLPPPKHPRRRRPLVPESDQEEEGNSPPRPAPRRKTAATVTHSDDDEHPLAPIKTSAIGPLPRPKHPRHRPIILESDGEEEAHSAPHPAPPRKKIRPDSDSPLPELTDDNGSSPPAPRPVVKRTPPSSHVTTKRRRQVTLNSDEEEYAPPAPTPPAKKIRSDSPLPELTDDDNDDDGSHLPPQKPMKQVKNVMPRPLIHASPVPTAKHVKVSSLSNLEPLIDDEDIIPEVPKKKGKKTSGVPREATKRNPPRKKRANGF